MCGQRNQGELARGKPQQLCFIQGSQCWWTNRCLGNLIDQNTTLSGAKWHGAEHIPLSSYCNQLLYLQMKVSCTYFYVTKDWLCQTFLSQSWSLGFALNMHRWSTLHSRLVSFQTNVQSHKRHQKRLAKYTSVYANSHSKTRSRRRSKKWHI